MILPLPSGRVDPARVSRWRTPVRTRRAGINHFDQQLGRLIETATAGVRSVTQLFGGVIALLLINLFHLHIAGGILAALLITQLAWGMLAARRWGQTRAAPAGPRDDAAGQERTAQERARRAVEWQRLNLLVNECATITALERLATERAAAITGAPAAAELSDAVRTISAPAADERVFRLAIEGGGALTVFTARGTLDQPQRIALEYLAMLAGIQAARLRGAARLARQQAALMALWEVAGVLRLAPDSRDAVREACRRMAAALDLEWLALLAPDEQQSLAALLVARGSAGGLAPHLSGAQIRVAAEALRAERPLVRSEGTRALACLPIHRPGGAPLVLAAQGDTADAATQALLLLLGELIIDRLTRPPTTDWQGDKVTR